MIIFALSLDFAFIIVNSSNGRFSPRLIYANQSAFNNQRCPAKHLQCGSTFARSNRGILLLRATPETPQYANSKRGRVVASARSEVVHPMPTTPAWQARPGRQPQKQPGT